jgi:hypothetical protein
MGQMLGWSQQIVQCLQGKEKVSLVTIIGEKKSDPLTVVFEENLKPGLTGYLTGSR